MYRLGSDVSTGLRNRHYVRQRKPFQPEPIALNSRLQLMLFVPETQSLQIEAHRREFAPVQAQLIAAHVTLCREDEFSADQIDDLMDRDRRWHWHWLWPVAGIATGAPSAAFFALVFPTYVAAISLAIYLVYWHLCGASGVKDEA